MLAEIFEVHRKCTQWVQHVSFTATPVKCEALVLHHGAGGAEYYLLLAGLETTREEVDTVTGNMEVLRSISCEELFQRNTHQRCKELFLRPRWGAHEWCEEIISTQHRVLGPCACFTREPTRGARNYFHAALGARSPPSPCAHKRCEELFLHRVGEPTRGARSYFHAALCALSLQMVQNEGRANRRAGVGGHCGGARATGAGRSERKQRTGAGTGGTSMPRMASPCPY